MPMDVVDYEIFGDDMQYVEIELDPGEAAIGEAGAMMMMQDGIEMDTIFGDGSAQQVACSASCSAPASGWSPVSHCSPPSSTMKRAPNAAWPFAAPYPGKIIAVKLSDVAAR